MFRYLNPKLLMETLGKQKFFEYIFFTVFLLFFWSPLIYTFILAFAGNYEYPNVVPTSYSFKWWSFVFSKQNLVSSIGTSLILAIVVTAVSMVICIPAAYAIARINFKGKRLVMLSVLLTNAFPKMGIYSAMAFLFYKYDLMGTFIGVVIVHLINSMMLMTWLPAGAFRSVHRQQEEAARDVGAGPIRTFLKVTFPLAMPGIVVAAIYTFLGSMEESQGTMIIGLMRFKTMPIEMYGVILDYPATAGAVFALILLIPTIILLTTLRKYIGRDVIANGFKMK